MHSKEAQASEKVVLALKAIDYIVCGNQESKASAPRIQRGGQVGDSCISRYRTLLWCANAMSGKA